MKKSSVHFIIQNHTYFSKVIVRDRAQILHSISATWTKGLNDTYNKLLTFL